VAYIGGVGGPGNLGHIVVRVIQLQVSIRVREFQIGLFRDGILPVGHPHDNLLDGRCVPDAEVVAPTPSRVWEDTQLKVARGRGQGIAHIEAGGRKRQALQCRCPHRQKPKKIKTSALFKSNIRNTSVYKIYTVQSERESHCL
jgi:hypothetical protein